MRHLTLIFAFAAIAAMPACATAPAPPIPDDLERLTYSPETPPFCGDCKHTEVTVASDGRIWSETGYWAGPYRNWRTRRTFRQVSPEVYQQFRTALEPFRPSAERLPRSDGEFCIGEFWSDSGGMVVTWSDANGSVRRWFTWGCVADRSMNLAVQEARAALPVPD